MIRIQLYNEFAGALTVIPDAQGTEDFDDTIRRSDDTDGVIHEYSLDLQFNKQSRAYLRDVFDVGGGIEATVIVNVFEYKPNSFRWEQIGAGKIKFTNFDIDAESVKTSIEQTGFQRKVLNLLEKDVDLETTVSQGGATLPGVAYLDLTLHSKKIIKTSRSTPTELTQYEQLDAYILSLPGSGAYRERIFYGQISTEKIEPKELNDSFALGWGWVESGDGTLGVTGPATVEQTQDHLEAELDPRINLLKTVEAGVADVEAILELRHEIQASDISGDVDVCGAAALGEIELHAWYEHRDADNVIKNLVHIGQFAMPNCGSRPDGNYSIGPLEQIPFSLPGVVVEAGDKIYIYETVRIYGNYSVAGLGGETVEHHFRVTPGPNHFISITSETITPPSNAKSYAIYEALERMFQYYTDQVDCFRSDYFNRTDTTNPADVDGPGSLRAIVSGANIRQVTGKTTFVNGKDFFGALNAIDCLGLGFELADGKQVVRIEPLTYFYNKDSLIADLGPVSDLHRVVDTKQYNNQIEQNYGKIDIQKTNALDEFGTLRRFGYPITQVSTKQLATTQYKISGHEIEDQRRKISSTEDSKNDDRNFFISLVRDGLDFRPKTNEGYILVENLYSPETAYNLDLSPRRNLDNWLKVIAVSLYKSLNKVIKFDSGEGNYLMVTQKTGEIAPKPEGGPGVTVDLTGVAPLYMPERYKFKCPLSSDIMAAIRANPYGYFKFQEFPGGPNLEGYLSKVTRETKKKLGTFELLKVYR
jgi:hypothetical protein